VYFTDLLEHKYRLPSDTDWIEDLSMSVRHESTGAYQVPIDQKDLIEANPEEDTFHLKMNWFGSRGADC